MVDPRGVVDKFVPHAEPIQATLLSISPEPLAFDPGFWLFTICGTVAFGIAMYRVLW